MIRKIFLLASLLFFPAFVFGQGVAVPPSTAFKVVNGITQPFSGATISVCAANTSGIPCSPVLTGALFFDTGLTQPKPNPFQADSNGNYAFAIAPGTYTITITGTGFAGYSYQMTSPGTGGGGGGGGGTTNVFSVGAVLGPLTFATLPGSAANGTVAIISDGAAGPACSAGGNGAIAYRVAGAWVCDSPISGYVGAFTVATLPTASAHTSQLVRVTDGTTSSDCTVGGGSTNVVCLSNGASWQGIGGSGSPAFSSITTATNNSAAMTVGTGGSMNTSGTGSIQATGLPGSTVASLPTTLPTNTLYEVTDAAQFGNCTTGGGSGRALCRWNGASWESIGGSTATSAFYALANGLVCDNATDDTAALNTLTAAMNTAGGGTLIFPHGKTCRFSSAEITLPNNADTWTDSPGTISSQAPIHWTCDAQNVQYQQLMSSGATLSQIQNACMLDFRFNAADAKLVGLGMGHFEVDHLAFVDTNTDCAPFMLFTNTIPDLHDNAFIGSTASVTSGPYSCNDAIIFGAAGGTQPGKLVSNWFQGYAGAKIEHNFFNQVKRATLLNNAAQTIMVLNNTVWSQSGCSTCGAFEVPGASVYGNTFSYNNIETVHYLYGLNITSSANDTMVIGQTCSDGTEFATVCVHTTGTDTGTLVLGGVSAGINSVMLGSGDLITSAMVLNTASTSWKSTLKWNGFINLIEQSTTPNGTGATEALFSDKTQRPAFTKWHAATVFHVPGLEEIPTTQTSTASDTFVRANSGTLGANWTAINSLTSLQILSNTAATQATGAIEGDYFTNITFPADQWSQCTVGTIISANGNYYMCAIRVQSGAESFYTIMVTSDGGNGFCKIRKYVAGTPTDLQACSPFTLVSGDTFLIAAVGTTISAYHNGILIATTTDSTFTSGSPGIAADATSAATADQYTAWSGGYMNCQPGVVTGLVVGNATATCTQSPALAGINMSTNSNVGTVLVSATAPTISSGFGTSPSIVNSNGTAAFTVNVGTGGSATSGVIGLPTATTGWSCFANDRSTNVVTRQTGTTTTTATFTAASAWTASDILNISCFAY